MKCFCMYCNIRVVDEDSAWKRRHDDGHFKGKVIPFGALIDFLLEFTTRRFFFADSL